MRDTPIFFHLIFFLNKFMISIYLLQERFHLHYVSIWACELLKNESLFRFSLIVHNTVRACVCVSVYTYRTLPTYLLH